MVFWLDEEVEKKKKKISNPERKKVLNFWWASHQNSKYLFPSTLENIFIISNTEFANLAPRPCRRGFPSQQCSGINSKQGPQDDPHHLSYLSCLPQSPTSSTLMVYTHPGNYLPLKQNC